MRTRPMPPNDRHGAEASARDRHGARELHTGSRHRRTQTTYGQRAPKCWHLAHGFRIERPSERMYFQRRRSFPSTGDWLVDAEHRVNEMRSCSTNPSAGVPGRISSRCRALDHRRAPLADRRQAPTCRHVPTCRRRRCGVRSAVRERRAACPPPCYGLASGQKETGDAELDASSASSRRPRNSANEGEGPWAKAPLPQSRRTIPTASSRWLQLRANAPHFFTTIEGGTAVRLDRAFLPGMLKQGPVSHPHLVNPARLTSKQGRRDVVGVHLEEAVRLWKRTRSPLPGSSPRR